MVLRVNDDEDLENKTILVNGNTSSSKPTTSAAAAAANNYYSNEKRSSSSSPSSSSSCSESSSDFEHSYKSLSSRIGTEYQVDLANYEVGKFNINDIKLKETLVWKPSPKINDQDIENFIFTACTKHAYTIEQALALLCWDNYDFSRAFLHMKSYVPIPNEWTEEDKIMFEQAYMFHGKNFSKIKQVLPDKSQASLVKFYYMWKKSRLYTSLIDSNQLNKTNGNEQNLDQAESNNKDNADDLNGKDDIEDDETHFTNNVNKICCNCDLIASELKSTPKGMLCDPCYAYWKETGGLMRPDIISKSNRPGSSKDDYRANSFGANNSREAKNFQKSLRKPPKGIYLNYEELVNLVEVDSDQTFDMLNKKLYCLKKEMQNNKQTHASLIAKLADEVESKITIDERLMEMYENAVESPCWTEHEIAFVIQGFNKYGTDFAAISQVLQTKSENSVKAFYNYYKDHFNLDKLILNNPKDLKAESSIIYNELTKLNSSDLPTSESQAPRIEILSTMETNEEANTKTEQIEPLIEHTETKIMDDKLKEEKKSDENDLILID